MRTRLVRIASLFTSTASIAAAALGLASRPALAQEGSGPAQRAEKPSSATPPGKPKAGAASPPAGASVAAPRPSAGASRAGTKQKAPELPPAPARVWLIAPSPLGPWTLRIDNEGERPMRIPADVRLLRLEIDTLNKRTKKTVRCAAPAGLKPSGFPERRALLLAPGQSYMEHFDPRLLCFGKDEAALAGGSVVRVWYGWGPPPRWSRKAPAPPFAVESTDDPPAFAAAPGLAAPTIVLSYDLPAKKEAAGDQPDGAEPPPRSGDEQAQPSAAAAQPPGDKAAQPSGNKAAQPSGDKAAQPSGDKAAQPPGGAGSSVEPIVDANAPRLELKSEPWSDAASPRSIVVRVSARNAGKRPMIVAVRPRMLEFHVAGPNGTTVCGASPPTGAIPRDLYRTLKPGASADVSLLLREVCPADTFAREGLYEVTPTLHANEPGTGLGIDAYTATVAAEAPTLLRVKSAPEPFYAAAPRAVPTPRPDPAEQDAAAD
ncbi:hypothetical protein [Sorangium sp. So ce233]|uniref:hypothetical protein n=1 Tax=Sorangium sp. So ce233 TaxID=3133290 RepID=UPI003F5F5E22